MERREEGGGWKTEGGSDDGNDDDDYDYDDYDYDDYDYDDYDYDDNHENYQITENTVTVKWPRVYWWWSWPWCPKRWSWKLSDDYKDWDLMVKWSRL